MIELGLIGGDSVAYAGFNVDSNILPTPMNGSVFSVTLDAVGRGSLPLANADMRRVAGLSFNGEPSQAYNQPYRRTPTDTNNIDIEVANFDAGDTGLEVTGIYWPSPFMLVGIEFSVLLDATGVGTYSVSNADTKKVSALSFNSEPSQSYTAPFRSDVANTTTITITVPNFNAADAGLEVTGIIV